MSTWRDTILKNFVPNISKLTLVADPDGLLIEETLAAQLRMRGFDMLEFTDAIEFRYAYESTYRCSWDQGQTTDLVVVLRVPHGELATLPYDLIACSRHLTFSLGELFPNLSYHVLEQLPPAHFDALFQAQQRLQPDRSGDNTTKDFILRNVFKLAADLISTETELLRELVKMHYTEQKLPAVFSERFIHILKQNPAFNSWPLESIVSDARTFFTFLQERWPVFLGHYFQTNKICEIVPKQELAYPGPSLLPFDHQDIRVYIDNLFVEGKLKPIELHSCGFDAAINPDKFNQEHTWLRCGIVSDRISDEAARVKRLFPLLEKTLPDATVQHTGWISFAAKWAELAALVRKNTIRLTDFEKLTRKVNHRFVKWLETHYAGLINLPALNPAMVHHIPRHMLQQMEKQRAEKVALIVVDGLSLDQWIVVKEALRGANPHLLMQESAVFAWVPTLTSISRQAIFAGKAPLYFAKSIGTTNQEEKLWRHFWTEHGFGQAEIVYQRSLHDGDIEGLLEQNFHPERTKVLGLVVDKVDKIMHGMQLGSVGMHNQIRQWCQAGFLGKLIEYLHTHQFEVWLTADHGNIECIGKGRPSEGATAEVRGERVRIYPTTELRARVQKKFPFGKEWQQTGLPANFFALVADKENAFTTANSRLVSHGGVSLEEIIVPLIKFDQK